MTDDGTDTAEHLQIGAVATETGLSIKTIRHYDEVGLVVPSARSAGGFRLYTRADIDRLFVIRRMKPLGFTLDDMRALLHAESVLDDTDAAPADRRAALEPVADLIALGETRVDLTGLLATLGDLGARTVLCEGGPDLNHQLLAAGLVDELCLTISPMLVGGAGATSRGLLDGAPFAVPSGLRLDQVSTHQGFLFCRYLIA